MTAKQVKALQKRSVSLEEENFILKNACSIHATFNFLVQDHPLGVREGFHQPFRQRLPLPGDSAGQDRRQYRASGEAEQTGHGENKGMD